MDSNGVQIREFTAADAGCWDAYVSAHPDGTFFHLSGWKTVLERAFGHGTHFFLAEQDGAVRGVLPLGRIRSWLFGDALISTPFCVYGGPLADDDAVRRRLEDAACTLAERLRVDYLELRNLQRRRTDWPCKELYVTFRKAIDPDPEVNMAAVPRKQRAMIRKGIKAGVEGRIDPGIGTFFSVYSESVRNLGTPVFPKRYFQVLREVFGAACEVLTVVRGEQAVGSVMSFYFRDEVIPYYGGGSSGARDVAGNDFMYWDLMCRATERGVRMFDFGRSKLDVGSFRFKKHWGFEPQPLYYEYHLVKADRVPDVNPLNPRYRLFIEGWKRLPLGVSRLLGPLLARSLG
ncbi:MAG TPA: FemAB family PEP-CTERM system-associated protein [Gammaproteobacteria bacterium]|nr:FemAB family PEP-CTERM system-associated protein [Gammaproteobacteria bacterium]